MNSFTITNLTYSQKLKGKGSDKSLIYCNTIDSNNTNLVVYKLNNGITSNLLSINLKESKYYEIIYNELVLNEYNIYQINEVLLLIVSGVKCKIYNLNKLRDNDEFSDIGHNESGMFIMNTLLSNNDILCVDTSSRQYHISRYDEVNNVIMKIEEIDFIENYKYKYFNMREDDSIYFTNTIGDVVDYYSLNVLTKTYNKIPYDIEQFIKNVNNSSHLRYYNLIVLNNKYYLGSSDYVENIEYPNVESEFGLSGYVFNFAYNIYNNIQNTLDVNELKYNNAISIINYNLNSLDSFIEELINNKILIQIV